MVPEIEGIGEAGLYVDDLGTAEDWYNTVLGLETAFKGDGYCFLQVTDQGDARQHVILFDPDETGDQSTPPPHGTEDETHLAFDVPYSDLEDWRDVLDDHNVAIEEEQSWPSGDHSLYIRDPAGNSIELYGQA